MLFTISLLGLVLRRTSPILDFSAILQRNFNSATLSVYVILELRNMALTIGGCRFSDKIKKLIFYPVVWPVLLSTTTKT